MKDVIVILGPTAVGKSALAVSLAQKLNGEIISADATQVYKGLNIGAAKVTKEEMGGIKHHLIDILDFTEKFNAFMFVNLAQKLIDDIISRGKTPIIVGGTNLYISALIKNYAFEKSDKGEEIYENKYPLKYHLFALNFDDRQKLYQRINLRVEKMLNTGLVQEVKALKQQGLNLNLQAGKGIGYREILLWLDGVMSYTEAVDKICQHSRNFAKRQLTWLRSMENLVWLDALDENNTQKVLDFIKK